VLSGSAAISIGGLTKRYGRLCAINNLDLQVPYGEVFGFLGLNGAGKTTTIRILLDLLRPTSGIVLGRIGDRVYLWSFRKRQESFVRWQTAPEATS